MSEPDADAPLDLGTVCRTVYDRAAYNMSLDYPRDPQPPPAAEDTAWARELLRKRGG